MESAWYRSPHWGRISSPPFQEILREPQAGQGAVTLHSALTLMRAHKANQLGGPEGMPLDDSVMDLYVLLYNYKTYVYSLSIVKKS